MTRGDETSGRRDDILETHQLQPKGVVVPLLENRTGTSSAVAVIHHFLPPPASGSVGSLWLNVGMSVPLQHVSRSVARTAILSLIKEREQLGFELAHAEGLMSDEQLDEVLTRYLHTPRKVPDLVKEVKLLHAIVPEKIDAELVTVVFGCSLDDAELVVAQVMRDPACRLQTMASLPELQEEV
jgi:hypothetical protein